jgi:hypothetical protein
MVWPGGFVHEPPGLPIASDLASLVCSIGTKLF